jgi:(E)-4-hydroxy-3-methylbut-2-enyl-diphosphate synthase
MGCEVNGPGESRDADVGLAAGRGKGVIFRKGKIIRRVDEAEMLAALKYEVYQVIDERRRGLIDEAAEDRYQPGKPVLALHPV